MKRQLLSLCSRPAHQHPGRRGTVIILSVVMMLVVLGITAFTVDFGVLNVTKGQVQNAADSAAHAGLQELSAAIGPGATKTSQAAMTAAGNKAQQMVARFRSGDVLSTVLDVNRDVRFGRRSWNSTNNAWDLQWGTSPYNMVEVTVRRTQAANSQLNTVFATVFGYSSFDVEAKSVAALAPVSGFSLPSGSTETLELFPFTVDLTTWNNLVAANLAGNPNAGGTTGGGGTTFKDRYRYVNGVVSSGTDEVLEINIYPDANTNLPSGNRGTVDIGSPNNSTNDLKRQIQYGINAYDLSYFPDGEIKFNSQGTLVLNGDTGISAGIQASLQAIIGQTRIMPIFTTVSGPGNNANYTIVRWVGIRIMAVNLNGGPNNRHLTVQPTMISTSHGIRTNGAVNIDAVMSQPVLIQ